MRAHKMLLALSTTALMALLGCATTPSGTREDTAASNTPTQSETLGSETGDKKGCGCAHKAQEGSAQAMEGKGTGCGCPHCAQAAKGGESHAPACGCSHKDKDQGQGGSPRASNQG
ncbi:hypothetical protein [Archangium sp.]|uniref:hypothetical protein n=1 Tax=Archangium sp. TaxID=1872627 RepID=UPI002D488F2B|nr:hypothetical protein [Archangium sp.]HYO53077.1 hypothetical protein [Archangium sp.]